VASNEANLPGGPSITVTDQESRRDLVQRDERKTVLWAQIRGWIMPDDRNEGRRGLRIQIIELGLQISADRGAAGADEIMYCTHAQL
jgi:hypothetical protein